MSSQQGDQDQADDLLRFAAWYVGECSGVPRPPFLDGVVRIDSFTGITMFRQPPYQVQLWVCDPGSIIPEHSHPGVDVIQVYVWGQVHLTCNGTPVIDESIMDEDDGVSRAYGATIRIKPGETHGARVGPMGGSFMTIQKWLDGPPRSVDTAWSGPPLGPVHASRIA